MKKEREKRRGRETKRRIRQWAIQRVQRPSLVSGHRIAVVEWEEMLGRRRRREWIE